MMTDEVIDLLDEIEALRSTINVAHFWISQGHTVTALEVLTKALFKEEE